MKMKKFINKPENIVTELLQGFALSSPDKIRLVGSNLVARAVPKAKGKVGVVTLGGHVATDADRAGANQIAQSLEPGGSAVRNGHQAGSRMGIHFRFQASSTAHDYRQPTAHNMSHSAPAAAGRPRSQL